MLFVFNHVYWGSIRFHFSWCSCRVPVKRWASLVEQEMLTLPSSPQVLMGFILFFFFLMVIIFCVSSFYGFCLYLWYLQTFLNYKPQIDNTMVKRKRTKNTTHKAKDRVTQTALLKTPVLLLLLHIWL